MFSTWELTNFTARLLLPPGGLIVLAMIGLALVRSHARSGATLGLLAVFSLYLLATPIVSRTLIHTLEYPYSDPLRHAAGAIVVLGGGSYGHAPEYGGLDTVSTGSLERVRYAASLHTRSGKPVLVTGGNPMGLKTTEAEQMRAALREFGVTARWAENTSKNTVENARYTEKMLRPAGIDSIYLVTNAWHIPRAKMAFEHAGLRVIPAPIGYKSDASPTLLDFVPSAYALTDSWYFFHEIAGIAWYRLKFARGR